MPNIRGTASLSGRSASFCYIFVTQLQRFYEFWCSSDAIPTKVYVPTSLSVWARACSASIAIAGWNRTFHEFGVCQSVQFWKRFRVLKAGTYILIFGVINYSPALFKGRVNLGSPNSQCYIIRWKWRWKWTSNFWKWRWKWTLHNYIWDVTFDLLHNLYNKKEKFRKENFDFCYIKWGFFCYIRWGPPAHNSDGPRYMLHYSTILKKLESITSSMLPSYIAS